MLAALSRGFRCRDALGAHTAVIVGGTSFGARGDYRRTVLGCLFLTELSTVLVCKGGGVRLASQVRVPAVPSASDRWRQQAVRPPEQREGVTDANEHSRLAPGTNGRDDRADCS
jgi:hypothetical protein